MKENLNQLVEILEVTLFQPFRFAEMVNGMKKGVNLAGEIITAFAALSLSVGAFYMTPPYNRSWLFSLTLMSGIIWIFLKLLPYLYGMVLDTSIREKKDRKENIQMAVTAARLLLVVFLLFAPLAVILVQTGLTGGRVYYLLLMAFIGLYLYFISSLFSILYEIEFKSSLMISLKAFGVLISFPVVFNLVFVHSIVKLFE